MTPLVRPLALALFTLIASTPAFAQVLNPFPINNVPGVWIDQDGTLKNRQTDSAHELATQRLRAKALNPSNQPGGLTYASLMHQYLFLPPG